MFLDVTDSTSNIEQVSNELHHQAIALIPIFFQFGHELDDVRKGFHEQEYEVLE